MPCLIGRKLWLAGYSLLWKAGRPLLRRNKRLAQGFDLRLAPPDWPWAAPDPTAHNPPPQQSHPGFDLWIQAASGGEAFLAGELIKHLPRALRILCTTWTLQGLDGLLKIQREHLDPLHPPTLTVNYFPLDDPAVMRRALAQAKPRLLVLLETELWPGLLEACRESGTKTMIVNGRLTPKSLAGLRKIKTFTAALAPERILAISPDDAKRFAQIFPGSRISSMPNIKFDRLSAPSAPTSPHTAPGRPPMICLASTRQEEEPLLAPIIQTLLDQAPQAALILAPRHLHRISALEELLERTFRALGNAPRSRPAKRSDFNMLPPEQVPFEAGRVLLWDSFGELEALYRMCDAVFVGGSLAPLGGQNFLEPLGHGLTPCIGPHWDNFYWVGEDLFRLGLVHRVDGPSEVAPALLKLLNNLMPREQVRQRLEDYLSPRRGGALIAAKAIQALLP